MPKKICIAPGHGGFDPGCSGDGLVEKNVTLAVGLALNELLKNAGIPTVMTRTGDYAAGHATNVQADLDNECTIANNAKADLFVCIHVNCCGGHGSEIYIYSDNGGAKEIATEAVTDVGGLMGLRDPAVKVDPSLWVLGHTTMPAFLLEMGFIDDAANAEVMRTNIQGIAALMAKPLITWAGGEVKAPISDITSLPEDVQAAIKLVEQQGIMTADEQGNFLPDETVNRWELAVVIDRLYQKLK